jgi:hypothetical protein
VKYCAAGGRVLAHSACFRHRRLGHCSASMFDLPRRIRENERVPPKSGPVAQLGARFHGMEEVIGSIPIRSTKHFNNLAEPLQTDLPARKKVAAESWASACKYVPFQILMICGHFRCFRDQDVGILESPAYRSSAGRSGRTIGKPVSRHA